MSRCVIHSLDSMLPYIICLISWFSVTRHKVVKGVKLVYICSLYIINKHGSMSLCECVAGHQSMNSKHGSIWFYGVELTRVYDRYTLGLV